MAFNKNTAILSLVALIVSQGVVAAPSSTEGLTYMRPSARKPVESFGQAEPIQESENLNSVPGALGEYEDSSDSQETDALSSPETDIDDIEPEAEKPSTQKIDEVRATRSSKIFKKPSRRTSSGDSNNPKNKRVSNNQDNVRATRSSKIYKRPSGEESSEGLGNADTNSPNTDENLDINDAEDQNKESEDSNPSEITEPEEIKSQGSADTDEESELSYKRPEDNSDKKNEDDSEKPSEGAGDADKGDPKPTTTSEVEPEYTLESKSSSASVSDDSPESSSDSSSKVEPESSSSSSPTKETSKPELGYKRPGKDTQGKGSAGVSSSSTDAASKTASSSSSKPSSTDEAELAYKRPENNDDKKDDEESYLDKFKAWYKRTFN